MEETRKEVVKSAPLMVTVTLPLAGPIGGDILYTNGKLEDVLTVM